MRRVEVVRGGWCVAGKLRYVWGPYSVSRVSTAPGTAGPRVRGRAIDAVL